MLSARFHCTSLAEWQGEEDTHVATLVEADAGSTLEESAFGLAKECVRVLVPPNALVVGRTYLIRIEEAPARKEQAESEKER
jgi:hypothetical protein